LTRRGFAGLLGAACLIPGVGHARPLAAIEGRAFGTRWRMVADDAGALDALGPRIAALFDEVDRQMSPWRPDSALSRFNGAAAGRHAAGDELLHVTRAALDLARQTGGAFDPTVGPLVARWGFGPIAGGAITDWRGLGVVEGALGKTRADLTLDLCGIAKGRALDRVIELARDAGLRNVLFDLGGELRALGAHPEGRAWRVAIRDPLDGTASFGALRLRDGQAVATSGVGEQGYALNGRVYGHIVDPSRGRPADRGLRSVTVVDDDAMMADGWATALFAAGGQAGHDMANAFGIAALFLAEADGAIVPTRSEAMRGMLL
jgi:thiamine biosynthesis lipoprotein